MEILLRYAFCCSVLAKCSVCLHPMENIRSQTLSGYGYNEVLEERIKSHMYVDGYIVKQQINQCTNQKKYASVNVGDQNIAQIEYN